jgi:hypothetical protein
MALDGDGKSRYKNKIVAAKELPIQIHILLCDFQLLQQNQHVCQITAGNTCILTFIYVPDQFAGYSYWIVFTPYPLENDRLENPTIQASHTHIA